MSYILDALNKSDEERARKKAPGISIPTGESGRDGVRPLHLGVGLVFLLLLNSIGLYLFFGDRLPEIQPSDTVTTPPVEIPQIANKSTPNTEPPLDDATGANVAPADIRLDRSRLRAVVSRSDLPASVRLRMPEFEITSHIYASDRDLRMARINEEPHGEGDQIAAGFWLVEITETGVIMAFEDYQFAVDVIEDWQL